MFLDFAPILTKGAPRPDAARAPQVNETAPAPVQPVAVAEPAGPQRPRILARRRARLARRATR